MTGTYRFKTGFYELTDLPAEFQKVMDYTLIGFKNTFCFLDDMLIVSKVSEEDLFQLVLDCLKKHGWEISLSEISWLGYNITQSGTSPLESKTSAILSLQPTKHIKS